MWFEGRGGDTANPMVWVHAGPRGAHPMGFHVSQQVWDFVTEHGLELRYDRRFVQGQLNAIKALLDSPPVQSALTMSKPAATSRSPHTGALGWVLGATALATAGVALVVHRRATGDRASGAVTNPASLTSSNSAEGLADTITVSPPAAPHGTDPVK